MKEDINETNALSEAEKYLNLPIHKHLNIQFIRFLNDFGIEGNILEAAEQINWERILNIYDSEVIRLWNKLLIPKNIEGLEDLKSGLRGALLQTNLHTLLYLVYNIFRWNVRENNLLVESFNKEIDRKLPTLLHFSFASFDFVFALITLSNENNPDVQIILIDKLKKLAERGQKLTGKKVLPKELKAFQMVLERYNELIQNNHKSLYSTIARQVARKVLGYKNKKEQDRFYHRFIDWKGKLK